MLQINPCAQNSLKDLPQHLLFVVIPSTWSLVLSVHMVGPQCAYGHQICKNSLVRSFFLSFTPMKEPSPLPPPTAPFSLIFVYEKSNTPTLKNARPATPDGSSRPSYPEKLGAPTGVEYQGVQCRVEQRSDVNVLSDVSSACGAPGRGHFSFIVSRDRFSGCAN